MTRRGATGVRSDLRWACNRGPARRWVVPVLLPACCASAGAGGCATPSRAAIQSADPNERIRGILAVAVAEDVQAVPLLVDRLEDEDEGVRFFAIGALRRITGRRFGYDVARPAATRAEAVERWRRFVHERGRARSHATDE